MRIRIEAPSSPYPEHKLVAGVERLRALGHDVTAPSLRGRHGYLNGTDDERRASLEAALADRSVDVVWLARGGYGLTRIVDELALPSPRAPVVVGFSDATALFGRLPRAGVPCVHGPLATTLADEPDDSVAHLLAVLERRARGKSIGPLTVQSARHREMSLEVRGPVLAANLCVLTHLIGTAAMPSLRGHIVVLEEVGERPYRLDRMLTQLRSSGALDGVEAVVVGHLTGCDEPAAAPRAADVREVREMRVVPSPLEVFVERLAPLGVPVLSGARVGHAAPNFAIPIGAPARVLGAGDDAWLTLDGELP